MKASVKSMIDSAQRPKTLKSHRAITVVSLNLREPLPGAITQDVVVLVLTDKTISSTVISRPRTTFTIFTQTLHKASQKLVTVADSDSTSKVAGRSKTFTRHLKVRKMLEIRDNHRRESKTVTISRTRIKMMKILLKV